MDSDSVSHAGSEPLLEHGKTKKKKKKTSAQPEESDSHVPIRSNLGSIFCKYKWHMVVMLATIITTILCCVLIPESPMVKNQTTGLTWESYFSINLVMATILLMLIGFPPDLILIIMSVSLTLIPCTRTQCLAQFPTKDGHGIDCSTGPYNNTCTIISMKQAWKGFTSTSVLSIGVLFMVAKGVEKTGIISYLAQFVLGNPKYLWLAIIRMCFPVAIISAFINDTPVVAVMMPIIESWAIKTGTPVSKLMIPLSYSALLGGMCTLTGTSTNLVLQSLVKADTNAAKDDVTVTMFEMTPVGACVAVACITYMALAARCLLPNHSAEEPDTPAIKDSEESKTDGANAIDDNSNRTKLQSFDSDFGEGKQRKFVVDIEIKPKSRIYANKPLQLTIFGANRDIEVIDIFPGPNHDQHVEIPEEVDETDSRIIRGGDVLVLAVTIRELVKLRQNRDVTLRRQRQITETLKAGRRHRQLFEAVVAPTNPIINSRVSDRFILSMHPHAEILAVRRTPNTAFNTESDDVTADHVIEAHDTLIVESYPSFDKSFKNDAHFVSITPIPGSTPPRNYTQGDNVRMLLSGLILVGMIVGIVLSSGYVFEWAILASYLLIWTQCLTVAEAYKAVKGRVILGILAAMGLGASLENTGVAEAVATGMTAAGVAMGSNILLLMLIYYCVALLSCVAGNQATVIILYPIVSKIVTQLKGQVSLSQFVVVLIMGASSSFMSPFSYQTNLMVWSAGKYDFADYPKFGGPMTLLAGVVTGVTATYLLPLTDPVA